MSATVAASTTADEDDFLVTFDDRRGTERRPAQALPSAIVSATANATISLSSDKIRMVPSFGIDHSLLKFVEGVELGGRPITNQDVTASLNNLLRLLPGEDVMVPEEGVEGDDGYAMLEPLLRETSRHLRTIGRVNIVVAGQTGVGKSSLINAVFGEDFAQTAAGEPVTQKAEWFASEKMPLRILDTKGLEAKDYAATVADLRTEIEACRAMTDARDQLHIGWLCISQPSSRIQEAELDVLRVLNAYDIPAIVVLTKYDEDPEFGEIVDRVLTERGIRDYTIVPVRAVAKPRRPALGLSELVLATFRALPQAHRAAFAAAQKVSLEINKEASTDFVNLAAAAAAAAAVVPIPIADALSLAPIQTGMLVRISATFGVALDRQAVLQLMTTVLGCVALSVAGRWAVGSALKLIPGAGSILGGILNAGLAGSLTLTLGRAYIAFLASFIETNGRVPLAEEILATFPAYYKEKGRTLVKMKEMAAE